VGKKKKQGLCFMGGVEKRKQKKRKMFAGGIG
jgi:hypothetical protein